MEELKDEVQKAADRVVELMKREAGIEATAGCCPRGAHNKTVGLMKGTFQVVEDVPDDLRVGIFAKSKTFPVLIRGSKSAPFLQDDIKPDGSGMALKLLGVEGERFSPFNQEKQTQDFLFHTLPTFFFKNVADFEQQAENFARNRPIKATCQMASRFQFKELQAIAKITQSPSSLLDIPFWSAVSSRFGKTFAKYHLKPTATYRSEMPKDPGKRYLSDAMNEHLSQAEATFDFYVQLFVNEEKTPINDALQEWEEKDSPFRKVATVHIPKQKTGTQARHNYAENLSFNPAHALAVHAPAGEVNLARAQIYHRYSKFRHAENNAPLIEPTIEDFERLE